VGVHWEAHGGVVASLKKDKLSWAPPRIKAKNSIPASFSTKGVFPLGVRVKLDGLGGLNVKTGRIQILQKRAVANREGIAQHGATYNNSWAYSLFATEGECSDTQGGWLPNYLRERGGASLYTTERNLK